MVRGEGTDWVYSKYIAYNRGCQSYPAAPNYALVIRHYALLFYFDTGCGVGLAVAENIHLPVADDFLRGGAVG